MTIKEYYKIINLVKSRKKNKEHTFGKSEFLES